MISKPDQFHLLTSEEAALLLRISPKTLARRRSEGNGPRYVKISHLVRYRLADLEEFTKENLRTCTFEDSHLRQY